MLNQLARASLRSVNSNWIGKRAASAALCVTTIRMAFCFCCRSNSSDSHRIGRFAIEVPGRLVAQQQSRPSHQRARQRDTLLFPSGQLTGKMTDPVRKADSIDQRSRMRLDPVLRRSDQRRNEHVLEHTALWQQAVILKYESDVLVAKRRKMSWRQGKRIRSVKRDGAGDGGSSAPRMYRSVLLPLPEGPVMAAASPGTSDIETSESTATSPSGDGYDLPTLLTVSTSTSR